MITLSQSLMKSLNHGRDKEELDNPQMAKCPARAKAVYLEGMESGSSDAMVRGNYFETLLFGGTDSGKVVMMERNKDGAKSSAQIRVESHAVLLKTKLKDEYVMDWHSPREHILVAINEKYEFRARTDMVTSQKLEDGTIAPKVIQDYKITDSILTSYGDFAWGMPHLMDHTQAFGYSWAFSMKYGYVPPFYYWVFDLSPAKLWKVVGGTVKKMQLDEFKLNLRRTIAQIEKYLVEGWPLVPSHDNCKGCPLKDQCPVSAFQYLPDVQTGQRHSDHLVMERSIVLYMMVIAIAILMFLTGSSVTLQDTSSIPILNDPQERFNHKWWGWIWNALAFIIFCLILIYY